MPGYRQSKKKNRRTRKKTKRPYASVRMRSSALGKAKSTPTKRSKSRRKYRNDKNITAQKISPQSKNKTCA